MPPQRFSHCHPEGPLLGFITVTDRHSSLAYKIVVWFRTLVMEVTAADEKNDLQPCS